MLTPRGRGVGEGGGGGVGVDRVPYNIFKYHNEYGLMLVLCLSSSRIDRILSDNTV